jgi:hypothetical protein
MCEDVLPPLWALTKVWPFASPFRIMIPSRSYSNSGRFPLCARALQRPDILVSNPGIPWTKISCPQGAFCCLPTDMLRNINLNRVNPVFGAVSFMGRGDLLREWGEMN